MNYQDIIKTDQGKKWGLIASPDYKKVYHKYNTPFLNLLLQQINHDNICIADYRGGNGILAKRLIDMCKNKGFKKFNIENIDIDENKFVEAKHLINIKEDIVNYQAVNKYDFAISRFVLHYIQNEKQLAFFKNVYKNLKLGGFFLFIHYIAGDTERIVQDFVKKEISLKRGPFLSNDAVLTMIGKTSFEIRSTKEVSDVLSINDFFRHRFQLNDFQIKELIKRSESNNFKGNQIAVLLQKT